MKKWKQLVVFVMILTMVMGMTSFAATPSSRSNDPTVTTPSLSGGSISGNEIVAPPSEMPETENNIALGLNITELPSEQKEKLAASLAEAVGALKKGQQFGKDKGDKLMVFELTAENHTLGTIAEVSIDCSTLIKGLNNITSKNNFRVLHHNGDVWENLPIVSYTDGMLNVQFKSFSPVCVVVSEAGKEDTTATPEPTPTPGPTKPTPTPGPTEPTPTPGPTEPTPTPGPTKPTPTPGPTEPTPTPGPTEPTPTPGPTEPTFPKTTSDKWKLTYDLVANKYNTFVLRWEAAEAGKYEVWYSATPDDSSSFKRLTTTKKTTYKFTKAAVGETYGFKIRVKGSDAFSETLYIRNEMLSRVSATTVSVTSKSYNSLQVKWDKIPGVKRYAIYRDGVKIAEKSSTKMTDKGLVTGKEYTYTVQPVTMKGAKGYFDGPMSAPVSNAPKMKSVSKINVKAVDSATLRITWSKVKGANYYTVCEVFTVDGKEVVVPVEGAEHLTTTRLIVTNLAAGSEHSYKVIANAGNGHTQTSKVKTARTKIVK